MHQSFEVTKKQTVWYIAAPSHTKIGGKHMIKIINGKKYNTETAKEIASWNNGCSYTDFNFVEETLYKKKTGEFFIHGHGGAMSCYCESCSGGWRAGDEIKPITINEAKKWLEEYSDADTYIAVFGDVEE